MERKEKPNILAQLQYTAKGIGEGVSAEAPVNAKTVFYQMDSPILKDVIMAYDQLFIDFTITNSFMPKDKKKKHAEHRRLLNKRTEAKKKARLQRQKVVEAVPAEEGPRSSDGIHSFPRDMPDFESSPQTFRGFWKETRPLYEHGYSALGHELVGHQVAYRLLTYANESLTHFIHSETPRTDVERLLRHRERQQRDPPHIKEEHLA